MASPLRSLVITALLTTTTSASLAAQGGTVSPLDSTFRRARRMVSEGHGVAGRALVDSLVAAAPAGSTAFGDALYWRGALAETAAAAERDYRRVIVEYPASAYADDALLSIAELEQARGDRAGALQHLQRFVREHPVSPARGTAALAAARLAFEQRDDRTGCGLLNDARGSTTPQDVELTNQIASFKGRCPDAGGVVAATPRAEPLQGTGTPTTMPVPTETPTVTTPPRRSSTVAPGVAPVPSRGEYTIQLAAYNTRADADRLVRKLAASRVTARVSGSSKPFRVRLGYYATRAAAQAEVTALRGRGIVGFVTTEPTGAPPR